MSLKRTPNFEFNTWEWAFKKHMIDWYTKFETQITNMDTMSMKSMHAIDFSTQTFFQCSLLKQLLQNDDFNNICEYVQNYEKFVTEWILEKNIFQRKMPFSS